MAPFNLSSDDVLNLLHVLEKEEDNDAWAKSFVERLRAFYSEEFDDDHHHAPDEWL